MATPIRVGIIGVGWGAIVQAPAFRAVPEYELVALCARRPERVAAAAEQLGVTDTSTDWQEFVRRDDLDLISVCTPVSLHAEQAIATVGAGKHLLCEKPVAVDAQDARRMLDAAESAGVAHAICFENRFEPMRTALRDLVDGGALGTPYVARSHTSADYWHPTRGLQSEWMYRLSDGGGYLMGMSSHDIDFVCELFGEPRSVSADVRSTVPERPDADGKPFEVDADDTSVVLVRMANGMLAFISCSAVAFGNGVRELELFGSDGRIMTTVDFQAGDSSALLYEVGAQEPTTIVPPHRDVRSGAELPKRRAAGAIRSLALMLEDWLPAFDGEPTPGVPTLRDGLRVQQVIDAARRSSAGEGWVDVSSV
ncbi:MAG TPA: Gfo/Idh/MocA family oxidoreductase [Acidimicrobiia bacterium]|jgi:predicted dehydrogenase